MAHSMIFNNFTVVQTLPQPSCRVCYHPRKIPHALWQVISASPLPQPQGATLSYLSLGICLLHSFHITRIILCLASFAQHYLYEFYPSFNFLNFAYCTCPILRILKNKFYKSRALILCLLMSGLHPLTWSFVHQALHPPVSLPSPSWASVQLGGCAPDPDPSLFSPLKCHCRRTVLGAPWWPCR